MAWSAWKLLEQTGWQWLPFAGGLLDQPEDLFEDLLTIAWRKDKVEEMMKKGPA